MGARVVNRRKRIIWRLAEGMRARQRMLVLRPSCWGGLGMLLLLSLAVGSGSAMLLATDLAPGGAVVLSEIQYNPPPELGPDEDYEYVELHNRGPVAVDLAGWRLKDRDDDHTFSLPAGTSLPPGGYLVIAGNAAALRTLHGDGVAIVGDIGFRLGNGGDTIRLVDTGGRLVDRVEYDDNFPWPADADGDGSSLERVSVQDDITDFTNFHPSVPDLPPGTPGAPNSRAGAIPGRHDIIFSEIMYHPVKDPDAETKQHCEAEEFLELHNRGSQPMDISGWAITRGVDYVFPAGTMIAPGAFLVVYSEEAGFREVHGDVPGAIGPYARRLDDGGEALTLVDAADLPVDHVEYDDSPSWPVNADGIRGSLELIDAAGDNDRAQAWQESEDFRGTPGAKNSTTIRLEATGSSAPPQITELRERPRIDRDRKTILSTDEVEVRAKVRDRDGVGAVRLEYQVVSPGDYISRTDPRFETEWTTVAMSYDAERLVYTAVLAAFPHRTLVRYRILATDTTTPPAQRWAPYQRDPEPNFGYFVYDGVPDYVASRSTGFGELGFTHTNLEKLPIYHFIMDQDDFDESWYVERDATDNTYSWPLTLVHENRVYDHCGMRLRGSPNSRYGPAKRSMKVRVNKGNRLRGRFNDGTPYPSRRGRISLHAGGFVDAFAHQLHHDSGGLSPRATFVQVRMINTADEHEQYAGDFLGLYADLQSIDKSLLRDNNRSLAEASSLYKMKGYPNKKHSDCDPSVEDFDRFYSASKLATGREWFEENLNLQSYFSFRVAIELTNNHDMDSLKNIGYYFNSELGLWEPIPWDVECSFHMNPCSGEEPLARKVPRLFESEYKSRYRFIWQVHFDLDRMLGMIDAWSDLIREVADANTDRWAREPRLTCPSCSDGTFSASSFNAQWIKDYIRYRNPNAIPEFRDREAPRTPTNALPSAGMNPVPPVRLTTLPFVDEGDSHAATHWMLIERGGDWAYPIWESQSATSLEEIVIPVEVTEPGKEYVFRAAHIDSTRRRSMLSEPTVFRVGLDAAERPAAPTGLVVEYAGSRMVTLGWTPADAGANVVGYRILREGTSLDPHLIGDPPYTDFGPPRGGALRYSVVAVNAAGLESTPSATVTAAVPGGGLGGWRLPPGGWEYIFDARPGETLYSSTVTEGKPVYLDGTWQRSSTNDWDGSAPGDPDGAPGGVAVESVVDEGEDGGLASVLSIEDTGSSPASPPANHRVFFRHGVGPINFLQDGITLIARLRVNPSPVDLPGPKGQTPDSFRGQIGVSNRRGPRGHFSFWLDDGHLVTQGGHSVPMEVTCFHSVWVVVEKAAEAGHRLRFFLDGERTPVIDSVVVLSTQGTENGFEHSYLEMGLSNLEDSGAIQIDYVGYRAGVHLPVSDGPPPPLFVRGDVNLDGRINIADPVLILNHLFVAAPVTCEDAGDVDDNEILDVTDAIRALDFLFSRGERPRPPFPAPGEDPGNDGPLACESGLGMSGN